MNHDFYTDADTNIPPSICDRNGQVALALCKRCGKAEGELTTECNGARKELIERLRLPPLSTTPHECLKEIEALQAELNKQVALVEKCMIAMNENADRGMAAEKEREALQARVVELEQDIDVQAGSIEAVQAANQRLAAELAAIKDQEPVRESLISYDPIYAYATANRLNYNELCAVVQAAIKEQK